MHQVIYSSAAVVPFSDEALAKLLSAARKNNERVGVTGMLLYHDGSFLQVLEGDGAVLQTLFERIGRDKRHHRVVSLLERKVEERHFAAWRMGFASLKNLPQGLPGYSDYMQLRRQPDEAGNAAALLLAAFRDGRFHNYVAA